MGQCADGKRLCGCREAAGHSPEHLRLNERKTKGRDTKAFSFDASEGSKLELSLQNNLFPERGGLKSVKQTTLLHLTPSSSQMHIPLGGFILHTSMPSNGKPVTSTVPMGVPVSPACWWHHWSLGCVWRSGEQPLALQEVLVRILKGMFWEGVSPPSLSWKRALVELVFPVACTADEPCLASLLLWDGLTLPGHGVPTEPGGFSNTRDRKELFSPGCALQEPSRGSACSRHPAACS